MNIYSLNNVVFQNIIDALPVLLFWTDKEHVMLGTNALHTKEFGFSSENEIIGRPMLDLLKKHAKIDDTLVGRIYKEHNEIVNSGKPQVLEYTVALADGKERIWQSYKQPLLDEKKQIIGLIGISFEITEMRQAQEALRQANKEIEFIKKAQSEFISRIVSENRYVVTSKIFQNIIDALPVLLFWTDSDHTVLGNNILHAKSFGYSKTEDIVGVSVTYVLKKMGFAKPLIEKIKADHQAIMETKKGQTLEYTVTLSDGNEGVWLSHKEPLMNENNEVIGLIGISMDITELKNTQKQLAEEKKRAETASQAKSEFIANMNHDLRTPLSGMSGMVQKLMQNTFGAVRDIDQGKGLSLEAQKKLVTNIQASSSKFVGHRRLR